MNRASTLRASTAALPRWLSRFLTSGGNSAMVTPSLGQQERRIVAEPFVTAGLNHYSAGALPPAEGHLTARGGYGDDTNETRTTRSGGTSVQLLAAGTRPAGIRGICAGVTGRANAGFSRQAPRPPGRSHPPASESGTVGTLTALRRAFSSYVVPVSSTSPDMPASSSDKQFAIKSVEKTHGTRRPCPCSRWLRGSGDLVTSMAKRLEAGLAPLPESPRRMATRWHGVGACLSSLAAAFPEGQ